MLTFVRGSSHPRKAFYRCECGQEVLAWRTNVYTGHTRSCGCLRIATTRARSLTHGHRVNRSISKACLAWRNLKARCKDTSDKNYGGRGITYDPRWESFEAFLADMGEPAPGMTIDRIDNNAGYSKENCRWVSPAVQNLNKRNVVRYEMNGESKTLAEWSRVTGVKRLTMLYRIRHGVPLNIALTAPPNQMGSAR